MDGLYEVLSPGAERDPVPLKGINPRVTNLNKVTIGFIQNGKKAAVPILNAVEKQMKTRFPGIRSKGICPSMDPIGITPALEEWLREVDTVVLAIGD